MKNNEEYDTSDKEEWQDASDSDWENYARWNEEGDSAEEVDEFGWLPSPGTTTESEEEDMGRRELETRSIHAGDGQSTDAAPTPAPKGRRRVAPGSGVQRHVFQGPHQGPHNHSTCRLLRSVCVRRDLVR